jgi:hypothetical protein
MTDGDGARLRNVGFGQKVRLFFNRIASKGLIRRLAENIASTDKLYLRVPKSELTLMSVGGRCSVDAFHNL